MYVVEVEIGEVVIYNGDTSCCHDNFTKDLMNRYLIKGNEYTISETSHFREHPYYRFSELGSVYRYPSGSFIIRNYKEFMIKKYKLK